MADLQLCCCTCVCEQDGSRSGNGADLETKLSVSGRAVWLICSCAVAGVPVKRMVAGVAMGLILEPSGQFQVLTDILGSEDALGDMDFKVAGDAEGVTAFQMDIKVTPNMFCHNRSANWYRYFDLVLKLEKDPQLCSS